MSKSNTAAQGGIGFFGMLTILFIGLKLTGYIDWSWFWVLSPLWVPIGLVFALLSLLFMASAILTFIAHNRRK